MNKKPWMLPLKQLLKKISQKEVWEYDPHAYHPRLEGQFGSEVRVFGKKFNHLVICIDISMPADVIKNIHEVIDFIDNYFKGVNRYYKYTHLNFWAESSYTVKSLTIKKLSLLDEVKSHYQTAKNEIATDRALASQIINPFCVNQVWAKINPDLLIILTSDRIENDLETFQKMRLNRYRKDTIWIYFPGSDDLDPSPILAASPSASKHIVTAND
jgi:hypothetical protein